MNSGDAAGFRRAGIRKIRKGMVMNIFARMGYNIQWELEIKEKVA